MALRYRGFEISVVQGIDWRFWKWTVSLDSRRLTGHASSKPKAFARAEIAIDQAVAPAQLIIGERAAGLLHEVRQLPPGPERDSILEEIDKVIAGLAALKTKARGGAPAAQASPQSLPEAAAGAIPPDQKQ